MPLAMSMSSFKWQRKRKNCEEDTMKVKSYVLFTSLDLPSYFLAKAADISARLSACVDDFSWPIMMRSFCLGLGVDALLALCFCCSVQKKEEEKTLLLVTSSFVYFCMYVNEKEKIKPQNMRKWVLWMSCVCGAKSPKKELVFRCCLGDGGVASTEVGQSTMQNYRTQREGKYE